MCYSKVSPGVKRYISEIKNGENPNLSVIIRTKKTLEESHKTKLEEVGAEIRTIAGNIVTLLLPAQRIMMLAKLDFVLYLQLSRPLYLEEK